MRWYAELVEGARLMVSELVTNCIRYVPNKPLWVDLRRAGNMWCSRSGIVRLSRRCRKTRIFWPRVDAACMWWTSWGPDSATTFCAAAKLSGFCWGNGNGMWNITQGGITCVGTGSERRATGVVLPAFGSGGASARRPHQGLDRAGHVGHYP